MIICDIFMPGMNGFEVCLRIKGNAKTKHIPVILMTSEDSKESEIKGLQMGADEYLRKPFSIEELNLRIINLLNSKKSIKEYYNSISHNIETGANSSNKDENFINQLTNLIVENMTDSSLNVDFLADNMNISRTKLYMRLKSITGMSATEFVNKVKIDIAMEKLMNDESSINEIAWRSGYNSPNYFSRIFRKYAGCSPSEFMKKRRKNRRYPQRQKNNKYRIRSSPGQSDSQPMVRYCLCNKKDYHPNPSALHIRYRPSAQIPGRSVF